MALGVTVLGSAIRSIASVSGSPLYGSVSVLRLQFDTDEEVGLAGGYTVDPHCVFRRVCFELCVLL